MMCFSSYVIEAAAIAAVAGTTAGIPVAAANNNNKLTTLLKVILEQFTFPLRYARLFNHIWQVAPVFMPPNTCFLLPTQPKQRLKWISSFSRIYVSHHQMDRLSDWVTEWTWNLVSINKLLTLYVWRQFYIMKFSFLAVVGSGACCMVA